MSLITSAVFIRMAACDAINTAAFLTLERPERYCVRVLADWKLCCVRQVRVCQGH